jgi:hypothetical protein
MDPHTAAASGELRGGSKGLSVGLVTLLYLVPLNLQNCSSYNYNGIFTILCSIAIVINIPHSFYI